MQYRRLATETEPRGWIRQSSGPETNRSWTRQSSGMRNLKLSEIPPIQRRSPWNSELWRVQLRILWNHELWRVQLRALFLATALLACLNSVSAQDDTASRLETYLESLQLDRLVI